MHIMELSKVEEMIWRPVSDTIFEPEYPEHRRAGFWTSPASDLVATAERWEELAEMPAPPPTRREKEALMRMDVPLINIYPK